VRLTARKRTFLIATSVAGKQFRMILRPVLDGMKAQGLTRRAMVERLNVLGIKAPMGGAWSLGQVQRALLTVQN